MSVTGDDLLTLGLPPGPQLAAALAEANRLQLAGPALQTFVRALIPAADTAPGGAASPQGGLT